jgi:peptidyl-prolyl cis-trans isomerase D
MFTGYETMKGTPGAVAQVGSYPIKGREYDNEYRRQINFYKNAIFQGKELTAKDIERFGIKKAALQNLVQAKTRLIFAERTDQHISPDAIKKTVKEFEFFQTGGQFDITRYKGLLSRNNMTPADFEDDMKNDLLGQAGDAFMSNVAISKNYLSDMRRFKELRYDAHILEITKANIKPTLKVSSKEISSFLAGAANKARVESLFKQRKESLGKAEKVTARHILIKGADDKSLKKANDIAKKLTVKNFKSMANKYTEDTSGKKNGGKLGEFGRGRMVPEFEKVAFSQKVGTISKPVKTNFGYHLILVEKRTAAKSALFSKYEKEIAKELVRDEKNKEIDTIMADLKSKAMMALKSGNFAAIKSMTKKYKAKYDENVEVNRFDGNKGTVTLEKDQMKTIFASMAKEESGTLDVSKGQKIQVITYRKNYNKDLPAFDYDKEKSGLQRALSDKRKQDILKTISESVKVKQFVKL